METHDRIEYEGLHKKSTVRILYNKILNILARTMLFPRIRLFLYRLMGIHVGKGVIIGLDCYLDDQFPELITIEDNAILAHRVTVVTHDGSYRGKAKVDQVIIKPGAHIGTGTIILPGSTIGSDVIIGAGAVVTKSIPDKTMAVGVPAKVIKNV